MSNLICLVLISWTSKKTILLLVFLVFAKLMVRKKFIIQTKLLKFTWLHEFTRSSESNHLFWILKTFMSPNSGTVVMIFLYFRDLWALIDEWTIRMCLLWSSRMVIHFHGLECDYLPKCFSIFFQKNSWCCINYFEFIWLNLDFEWLFAF